MIRNYLKIAWRNLLRNKGFSFINLLGLTIGITSTIFIALWVQDELAYNKFQTNYNSIYKIMAHRDFNNQVFTDQNMVLPLAKTIQEKLPQVKNAVVTTHQQSHVLTYGDVKLKQTGYTVSDRYFDMFSWKFIKGTAAAALPDAYSIVLTKSAATALFGNMDPIDKMIKVDNEYDAKVTAIVADPPGNSTFQFDFINSFNYAGDYLTRSMTDWQNSSWQVYIQLNDGANLSFVEKNINDIKYQHDPGDKKISSYFAFPMSQWRLYSDFKDGKNTGGMISYVRLFSIIAFIILLIACVNFMNLSTARSEKRAKEVGVRKTLGSGKKPLVFQFLSESIILALAGFVLSVAAVFLLLPSFNKLVDKQLTLDITHPYFWLGAVAIILITGILAGSYPALYLSSFNPIRVLKGTFVVGKSAIVPRRILVVIQFATSILLISGTVIVYQQIKLIKNRDTGYNPNNLIAVPTTPDTQKNFAVIKQELLNTGMINSMTRTMSPITQIWWRAPSPEWDGKPANANIIFTGQLGDVEFTKTMGIKILQGRDFSGTPGDSTAMLLNKSAIDVMGLKNPVGMQLRYSRRVYTVIGVTDNFVMDSPFEAVPPMMIMFNPNAANWMSMRLNAGIQPQAALAAMETIFKKHNPAYPFEYQFVDQEFGKKFLTEELIGKLTNIFAGLAIFICCIGLAGLASFTVQKRIREIGIRKVLGASMSQLLALLSKDFLKLVLIAFVIAVPLAWWFMNGWLDKYEFRVNISVWLFGIVGLFVLLLALVIVSLSTMKATVANPVKSLRTE